MSEPRWIRDLDLARYRASQGAQVAAAWVAWLIGELPPKARAIAARAWRDGKMPSEVRASLREAMPDDEPA